MADGFVSASLVGQYNSESLCYSRKLLRAVNAEEVLRRCGVINLGTGEGADELLRTGWNVKRSTIEVYLRQGKL